MGGGRRAEVTSMTRVRRRRCVLRAELTALCEVCEDKTPLCVIRYVYYDRTVKNPVLIMYVYDTAGCT